MRPEPGFAFLSRIDRRLAWALIISLVVHGLGLLSRDMAPPPGAGPAILQGSLRPPSPPAVAAGPPPRLPAPAAMPGPHPRAEVPRVPVRTLSLPSPAPVATAVAVKAGNEDRIAAAPAVAESTSPSLPAATASVPASPAPLNADGLRQYRMDLGRAAKRLRSYPPQAREAGWEGRLSLRISLAESGQPTGIVLTNSSGFKILDQAGLELIHQAANRTSLPDTLRGRAFSIDLTVDYRLDDL